MNHSVIPAEKHTLLIRICSDVQDRSLVVYTETPVIAWHIFDMTSHQVRPITADIAHHKEVPDGCESESWFIARRSQVLEVGHPDLRHLVGKHYSNPVEAVKEYVGFLRAHIDRRTGSIVSAYAYATGRY